MLKDEVNKLNLNDIYSLILFVIFQLKKLPEYAVLSELVYSVDQNSLLNLCKQFGGMTITIPTLDELNDVLDALLIYCYVNIENKSFDYAISLLNREQTNLDHVKEIYMQVVEVTTEYDFRRN